MYYGLSNFYQNHRLYVMSKDINQLAGGQMSGQLKTTLTKSNCYPYVGDRRKNIFYAPCGLIANSLFNGCLSILLLLLMFITFASVATTRGKSIMFFKSVLLPKCAILVLLQSL